MRFGVWGDLALLERHGLYTRNSRQYMIDSKHVPRDTMLPVQKRCRLGTARLQDYFASQFQVADTVPSKCHVEYHPHLPT